MKKLILILLSGSAIAATNSYYTPSSNNYSNSNQGSHSNSYGNTNNTHQVQSYTKSDGTYVQSHTAGNPNSGVHCHNSYCN